MKLRLLCSNCGTWSQPANLAAPEGWPCPSCAASIPAAGDADPESPELIGCRCCGGSELYVQKDFPHWLGMGILVVACIVSVITYSQYWIKTTWAILIGSAVIDAFLYVFMGNVTICYRCQTQHRGFRPNPDHRGFDLAIAEKHRQEKLRRRELERK